ncbi:MAG: tetratricopeptide repeat protein, partial [Caldilineae bacterium]
MLVLTALILLGLWFIQKQPEWARPFEPTPTPTLPASYYLTEGDIAFAEGQLQQAVEAYEAAIALEPDNDAPYMKAARTLIYLGDTARALTRAEQAVLLQPDSAPNLAEYCRALDWEGQYSPAFDACDCAIELDPTYAPGYAYLSEVYADQADWVPARTTAQQALDVDFQSPEAHHNMGYALEVQGRYAQAVEFYENAITLRPKLAPYYMAAGRNYYWLGQFDKAADRFGEAIKLDPANPAGYDQLGWTYHANGEDGRAIDALEQAIGVDPTHARAWGRLGTIYYLRQNYEEALKILPTAIELAENQFLSRARKIQILTQVEGLSGPETVPILQGRFEHPADPAAGILTADIRPIRWTTEAPQSESNLTCGRLIARNIQNQIVLASPVQDIAFSRAFSQTTGRATLNLSTGELTLQLNNLPPPRELPYEVQIRYRPDQTEGLGYIQPDAQQRVETQFTIAARASAPVEYYYELGLSYVYLTPPRCEEAIPWLLKALDKDPAYYNPAWAGLKICPTENAPPTPLP